MKELKIVKGWFRAAGNVYRWTPQHHIFGVGIDMKILEKEDKILLSIAKEKYILDCKEALTFISAFSSKKTVKGGVVLGIVSKSTLIPSA